MNIINQEKTQSIVYRENSMEKVFKKIDTSEEFNSYEFNQRNDFRLRNEVIELSRKFFTRPVFTTVSFNKIMDENEIRERVRWVFQRFYNMFLGRNWIDIIDLKPFVYTIEKNTHIHMLVELLTYKELGVLEELFKQAEVYKTKSIYDIEHYGLSHFTSKARTKIHNYYSELIGILEKSSGIDAFMIKSNLLKNFTPYSPYKDIAGYMGKYKKCSVIKSWLDSIQDVLNAEKYPDNLAMFGYIVKDLETKKNYEGSNKTKSCENTIKFYTYKELFPKNI